MSDAASRFLHGIDYNSPLKPDLSRDARVHRMRIDAVRNQLIHEAEYNSAKNAGLLGGAYLHNRYPLVWDGDYHDNAKRVYRLYVYSDLIRVQKNFVSYDQPEQLKGKKRSKIFAFSAASRRRFAHDLAMARDLDDKAGYFITLTYPDISTVDRFRVKADLHAIKLAITRYFADLSGSAAGWWRMELKTRKSGLKNGAVIPHFHLLLFTDLVQWDKSSLELLEFRQWLTFAWGRIVSRSQFSVTAAWWLSRYPFMLRHGLGFLLLAYYSSAKQTYKHQGKFISKNGKLHCIKMGAGTNCRLVNDRPHAMRYVMKYATKASEDSMEAGRRWGRFGEFNKRTFYQIDLSYAKMHMLKRYIKRLLKDRKRAYKMRNSQSAGWSCLGFGAQSNRVMRSDLSPEDSLISKLFEHVLMDGFQSSVKF